MEFQKFLVDSDVQHPEKRIKLANIRAKTGPYMMNVLDVHHFVLGLIGMNHTVEKHYLEQNYFML